MLFSVQARGIWRKRYSVLHGCQFLVVGGFQSLLAQYFPSMADGVDERTQIVDCTRLEFACIGSVVEAWA